MKFNCPNCQNHIEADPDFYGTTTTCPHCSERIQVPVPKEEKKKKTKRKAQPRQQRERRPAKPAPVGGGSGGIYALIFVPLLLGASAIAFYLGKNWNAPPSLDDLPGEGAAPAGSGSSAGNPAGASKPSAFTTPLGLVFAGRKALPAEAEGVPDSYKAPAGYAVAFLAVAEPVSGVDVSSWSLSRANENVGRMIAVNSLTARQFKIEAGNSGGNGMSMSAAGVTYGAGKVSVTPASTVPGILKMMFSLDSPLDENQWVTLEADGKALGDFKLSPVVEEEPKAEEEPKME